MFNPFNKATFGGAYTIPKNNVTTRNTYHFGQGAEN